MSRQDPRPASGPHARLSSSWREDTTGRRARIAEALDDYYGARDRRRAAQRAAEHAHVVALVERTPEAYAAYQEAKRVHPNAVYDERAAHAHAAVAGAAV